VWVWERLSDRGQWKWKVRRGSDRKPGKYRLSHRVCLKPVVDTERRRLTLARMGREDSREVGMMKGPSREAMACRRDDPRLLWVLTSAGVGD
jgi:ribosomal protein L32